MVLRWEGEREYEQGKGVRGEPLVEGSVCEEKAAETHHNDYNCRYASPARHKAAIGKDIEENNGGYIAKEKQEKD
jgi:hypothetical protein